MYYMYCMSLITQLMPTGSVYVIVGRASSSELSDGMRCLVGEEGSVEAGVSTEIEEKTDSHVCISYMYRCCAGGWTSIMHVRIIYWTLERHLPMKRCFF